MKKATLLLFLLLMNAMLLIACNSGTQDSSPADPEAAVEPITLYVMAAASLQDAGDEIAILYKEVAPHVTLQYNYAASGTLQKQIEEGAPADFFISAGKKQMDALAEQGLLAAGSRQDLLSNELVLITPQSNVTLNDFDGLLDDSIVHFSIGTPESVPAGQYAQESLIYLQLWDELQDKLVMGKDVREVLTWVDSGNAEAGMVYKSDTIGMTNIRIVCSAPEESHAPIVYPMAVLQNSAQQEAAAAFLEYMRGAEASAVLIKYGFTPLAE